MPRTSISDVPRVVRASSMSGPMRSAVLESLATTKVSKKDCYLSDCAVRYARALKDPFNPDLQACIPIGPCFPSAKYTVFKEGTGATNSAGFGWVAVSPNDTFANDSTSLKYTSSAFVPTVADFSATGTGINLVLLSNGPATAAQTASAGANRARIVGLGLRVRFIGKELDRAGRVCGMMSPNHLAFGAGVTMDTFTAYKGVTPENFSRKWYNVCYAPVESDDLHFHTSDGLHNAVFYMGVLINTTDSQPFEWQIYSHIEFQGPLFTNKGTVYSDPVGMAAIQMVDAEYSGSHESSASAFKRMISAASDALTHTSSVAGGLAAEAYGVTAPRIQQSVLNWATRAIQSAARHQYERIRRNPSLLEN